MFEPHCSTPPEKSIYPGAPPRKGEERTIAKWNPYEMRGTNSTCTTRKAENSPGLTQKYRRRRWHPTPVLLPGGLQSMGSLGVGHDWATSLSLFTCMHWRRKWQPTPVFLPGECQGQGSLVGCPLWGRTESDATEQQQQHRNTTLACTQYMPSSPRKA